MFQPAPPLVLTCTAASFSTNVLWTSGAGSPAGCRPDRSTGSSQRRLPLGPQLAPDTCVTACEAANATRISGAHELVQPVCASRQPGESHSTVAGTMSRG